MKFVAKIVLGLGLIVGCTTSAMAAGPCFSKLSNFWINGAGDVYAQPVFRGDHLQVCNVKAAWKGIDPVVCMGWVSILRSAVANNVNANFYYDSTAPACNVLPTYSNAPAPYYIMLYPQ